MNIRRVRSLDRGAPNDGGVLTIYNAPTFPSKFTTIKPILLDSNTQSLVGFSVSKMRDLEVE